MLDDVCGMADHAGNEQLAFRQLRRLPDAPFMLVAHVSGFHRIGACIDAQHQVDDVLQRDVRRMRAVPAAPADMVTDAIFR